MSHVYKQSTGEWRYDDGALLATGYSGHGEGVNNPALEAVPDVGPIPRGKYIIGIPYRHPKLGKICMNLTPVEGNKAHGRTLFRIHGDNTTPDPTDGSHGCIILPPVPRQKIADSGDILLTVIE